MKAPRSGLNEGAEACPIPVRWSGVESILNSEEWGANCGPHSIAAACGVTLDEVRRHIHGPFKGWMNPTMIGATLASLGTRYSLRKGLKTKTPCNGINRVQWEGSWLNPGVPVAAAYHHTHFIAHFDGWVFCTMACNDEWVPLAAWEYYLAVLKKPWHITHHYSLPQPNPLMTTLERIVIITSRCLNIAHTPIKPPASFMVDLGADALDCVAIRLELEDEFEIDIPEANALSVVTVAEMVALIDEILATGVKREPRIAPAQAARPERQLLADAMGEDERMRGDAGSGIGSLRRSLDLSPSEELPMKHATPLKDVAIVVPRVKE